MRYSLENPLSYVDRNLVGFGHIIEGCRHNEVEHLVHASSSSVYGANTPMPFSVHHNVDHPLSLYAATKKANVDDLVEQFDCQSSIPVEKGVASFAE